MPRANVEHKIQASIIELWKMRGRRDLDLFAIPNGGARNVITARLLKAEGVLAGVPDLCVILDDGRVGWLEVKAPKGRLTPEQREFSDRWQKRGHKFAIVRDVKDASIVLAMWGALRGSGRDSSE